MLVCGYVRVCTVSTECRREWGGDLFPWSWSGVAPDMGPTLLLTFWSAEPGSSLVLTQGLSLAFT